MLPIEIPKENATFWSFPYVCPEPVLVKGGLLGENGAKTASLPLDEELCFPLSRNPHTWRLS
jgi:hypothetical protein